MSRASSLMKDRPDHVSLHSPVWREHTDVPVRTPREHVPLFYTRAGAALSLEGLYRGGHAFLMAGGPSVKELDLEPLHRRWVMTLNNGASVFKAGTFSRRISAHFCPRNPWISTEFSPEGELKHSTTF